MTEFGFVQIVGKGIIEDLGLERVKEMLMLDKNAPDDYRFKRESVAWVGGEDFGSWLPCPDETAEWEQWFFGWSIDD